MKPNSLKTPIDAEMIPQVTMFAFSRSVYRTTCRNLQRSSFRGATRATRPIASNIIARKAFHFPVRYSAAFSTMPALHGDAIASPSSPNEFDNEIVDVASYVHNYKIDSDVAVSIGSQIASM
jgi:2-methylcitrate dehydratase